MILINMKFKKKKSQRHIIIILRTFIQNIYILYFYIDIIKISKCKSLGNLKIPCTSLDQELAVQQRLLV